MCRECRERFSCHRLQRKLLVSDPAMHHGTCVTHVPWCMSGLLTCGGWETFPAFLAHVQPAILCICQGAYAQLNHGNLQEEFAEALALTPDSLFVTRMFEWIDREKKGYISFREMIYTVALFAKGTAWNSSTDSYIFLPGAEMDTITKSTSNCKLIQ